MFEESPPNPLHSRIKEQKSRGRMKWRERFRRKPSASLATVTFPAGLLANLDLAARSLGVDRAALAAGLLREGLARRLQGEDVAARRGE